MGEEQVAFGQQRGLAVPCFITTPCAAGHSLHTPLPTQFLKRHLGAIEDSTVRAMLNTIGFSSLEELIDATVPNSILKRDALALPEAATESEALAEMKAIARMNTPSKSLIGMGYYGTKLPSVIQRNMTENPDWYTSYTPYQAEISQGRLEMLLNFQTMVADLTGMEVSNASLLDEATAAAEAMTLAANATGKGKNRFFVAEDTHPQVIDVILSRAKPMGINVQVGPLDTLDLAAGDVCGVLVQYPNTYGSLVPAGLHRTPEVDGLLGLAGAVHDAGALLVASADLMALTHVTPPGEWGADVVVGSAQRFGVPLGYGGPHAGFLALLANMAAAYGVYHGPAGLRSIAHGIHARTAALASLLRVAGHNVLPEDGTYFDTFTVAINPAVIPGAPAEGHAADIALQALSEAGFDARRVDDVTLGISLDEALSPEDVGRVAQALGAAEGACPKAAVLEAAEGATPLAGHLQRTSSFMTHPVFNTHHTESQMMRYLSYLAGKDVSLTRSMIALGSCTMKLNSAAEMAPVTWPEFTDVHPFVPVAKAAGYATMIQQLSQWLANVTGFQAVSMQPNSGAAGEYAGLLAIKQCLEQEGQGHRNICLIPASAHGTNPASAVMAGMKVVVVKNDPATGAIDGKDLDAKLAKHAGQVAAVMVTYPSTYGVYEDDVAEL
ncbi:gcvP, partial [Symbiodinium sp. KB8]